MNSTNNTIYPLDPSVWSESSTSHIAYDSYFSIAPGPSRLSVVDEIGDSLSPQLRSFYGYDDSFNSDIPAYRSAAPGSHIGATGSANGVPPFDENTPVDRARWGVAGLVNASGNWQERFITADFNPANGRRAMFLGQLTVNRGAAISGGVVIYVSTGPYPGHYEAVELPLNGPSIEVLTDKSGPEPLWIRQPLVLRTHLVATNDDLSHSASGGNLGSGTGINQRFGAADVYHLWVEAFPSPGPVMLFAFAGVAAARRRRVG